MLQKVTTNEFVHTFCEIWKSDDRKFCFVLGAGASKSSGIRTGAELAASWLDEIQQRMKDQNGAFDNFIKTHNIDSVHPGSNYSEIYKERFKLDAGSGFDYINREMENSRPGFGYSVLAQILAAKHHNIVITTNFDNLTEDALYTYTPKRPLICGHESLAAFAKPSVKRPLIVKIHRDRFLSPQSLPDEVDKMYKPWVDALNPIFHNSIPIFIGYGGNDGSLMGYLEQISHFDNLFWCERKGTEISQRVQNFLDKHNGKLVEIDGFDELMFLLRDGLDLPLLANAITKVAEERAQQYRETVEAIQKKLSTSSDPDVQAASERIVQNAGDDWWVWALKASAAKTNDEKDKIYKDAISALPQSVVLLWNYAIFLKNSIKNYDEAERCYKKAIELSPNDAAPNASYALFLRNNRKNYIEAEKYYKKAIELAPNDGDCNGNYSGFLLSKGDIINAKRYLDIALLYCDGNDLKAELQFYLYAHFTEKRAEAFQKLKNLLCEGVRSLNFDLQDNVDRAIKDGHPDPEMLQRLADILTKDAPIGDLCDKK